MLRPAIRVRINRATTAVVVDYAMYNGFFISTTRGDRLRQQHRQPGLQCGAELSRGP